jgi:hypothetical protein
VFVLFVLGSGLATGRSPVQGVLPTVLDYEKIKFTYLDTLRYKRSRLRKKFIEIFTQ